MAINGPYEDVSAKMQQTCVAEKPRNILAKLELLDMQICVLHDAADTLECRLRPAISMCGATEAKVCDQNVPPAPPESELAMLLDGYASRVTDVTRQLHRLIDGLEI